MLWWFHTNPFKSQRQVAPKCKFLASMGYLDLVLSEYLNKSHNFKNLVFYDVTPLVLYWPQKKGVFQKSWLAGRTSHFESEINHHYDLGMNRCGWIVLICSEFILTTKLVWSASSSKWQEPITRSEQLTSILGCHGVFTDRFIFRHNLWQFSRENETSAKSMNAFEV